MAAGRPKEYNEEYHPQHAGKLCLLGYTNKDLALTFGVAERTISRWLKEHEEFCQAVIDNRQIADADVAQSFFNRAKGFEMDSEKLITVAIGDGCSEVQRHPIKVYFPPDAGAALNWLKNRQPGLWRDKQDVALTGEITVTMNLDGDSKTTETAGE